MGDLWAEENPHGISQKNSQRKFSINVWCGLLDNNLIGPHIFEGTLNGEMYLNFLRDTLPELLQGIHIRGLHYQHDGAGPHYLREVRQHLNDHYPNRWIGRNGPVSWPARSPDLTPVDYFLWGHLKQKVYATDVTTREELRERIEQECTELKNNPHMIRNAINNLELRARKCVEVAGRHFENLL